MPPRGGTPLDPTVVLAGLFAGSVVAGFAGSLLGLGGGFLLVPLMTLVLGVPVEVAVAVSIVAVVATSTGSGAASVRRGLANTRLGMFLEVATSLGGIAGALLAFALPPKALIFLFGMALLFAVPFMIRTPAPNHIDAEKGPNGPPSRLRLDGRYENALGELAAYRAQRPALGFGLSAFAGVVSGLLGIGGGIIKVPTMHAAMHVPIQVAIGTSNFMIGVTASAAALVYFSLGRIDPVLAGTAVIGVVLGTRYGTRHMERVRSDRLALYFCAILVLMAASMFLKASGVIP